MRFITIFLWGEAEKKKIEKTQNEFHWKGGLFRCVLTTHLFSRSKPVHQQCGAFNEKRKTFQINSLPGGMRTITHRT